MVPLEPRAYVVWVSLALVVPPLLVYLSEDESVLLLQQLALFSPVSLMQQPLLLSSCQPDEPLYVLGYRGLVNKIGGLDDNENYKLV